MNLENIDIVKISDSCYKVYQLVNLQRKSLEFELNDIITPFGLEHFQHVYYINWQIDNVTLDFFKKLELEFIDIIIESDSKFKSWSYISNLKEKIGFEPLIKTRIKEIKKKFQIETNINLFEIEKQKMYKITISLDSIWFMEKNRTYGFLWLVKSIF